MANRRNTPTNRAKLVKISRVLFSLGSARHGDLMMKNGKIVDLIMEDIVGVRKLTKKVSSAVEDNNLYQHLGDLDVSKLYKMLSNEDAYYVIIDLVSLKKEIEMRKVKLKKCIKDHKGETKKLSKKIQKLTETYKAGIKSLRKAYGFKKKSKEDELNRYPALQKLIKRKESAYAYLDEDDDFDSIFGDDDDDDDDDALSSDYSLMEIFDDDDEDDDDDWEVDRHTPVSRRSRKSNHRREEESLFDRPALSSRLDADILSSFDDDDDEDDFEDDDDDEYDSEDDFDDEDEDEEFDEEDEDDEEGKSEEEILKEFYAALYNDGRITEDEYKHHPLTMTVETRSPQTKEIRSTSDQTLAHLNASIAQISSNQAVFASTMNAMIDMINNMQKTIVSLLDTDDDEDDEDEDDEEEKVRMEEEDDDDEDDEDDLRAIIENALKQKSRPAPGMNAPTPNEASLAMARMFEEAEEADRLKEMQQEPVTPVFNKADIEEEPVIPSISAQPSEPVELNTANEPTLAVIPQEVPTEKSLDEIVTQIRKDYEAAEHRMQKVMATETPKESDVIKENKPQEKEEIPNPVVETPDQTVDSLPEDFPKVIITRGQRQTKIEYDDRFFTIECPTIKKSVIDMPIQRAMRLFKAKYAPKVEEITVTEVPQVTNVITETEEVPPTPEFTPRPVKVATPMKEDPHRSSRETDERPKEEVVIPTNPPKEDDDTPIHIAEYGDPDFIGPLLPPDHPREIERQRFLKMMSKPDFDPYEDMLSPHQLVMNAVRSHQSVKMSNFMDDMEDDDDDEDEEEVVSKDISEDDDDDEDDTYDEAEDKQIAELIRKRLVAEVNDKNSKLRNSPARPKPGSTV